MRGISKKINENKIFLKVRGCLSLTFFCFILNKGYRTRILVPGIFRLSY